MQILRRHVSLFLSLLFPPYPPPPPHFPFTLHTKECREEENFWSARRGANGDGYIGGFFRAHLKFPSEYPHLPPSMKFESRIFHPNSSSLFPFFSLSLPPPTKPLPSKEYPSFVPKHELTASLLRKTHSLPHGRSLHLNSTPARRGRVRLRIGVRTLVSRADA